MKWTVEQENLVRMWSRVAVNRRRLHTAAQEQHARLNRMLGVPCIMLQAIIATMAFSSVGTSAFSVALQLVQGILMVISAGLSGAHQFLGYERLPEQHKYPTHPS